MNLSVSLKTKMKAWHLAFCTVMFMGLCTPLLGQTPEGLEHSLVRLSVTYQSGRAYTPWRWQSPSERSGQGLVVGDNLVLTLASIVKEATLIEARLNAEPTPTVLKVEHVDLDRGIALLRGVLPTSVHVLDLPKSSQFERGGLVKSYWKTQEGRFMEGQATLDRAEAALLGESYLMQLWYEGSNVSVRGGYGEPIYFNGVLMGIGVQNGGGAELSILPVEMIHKRYELPSGKLKPDTAMTGFVTTPCTQRNLRRLKGLKEEEGGCMVIQVMEQGSGSQELKVGDVLLKFAHHSLDAWGRYKDEALGWLSWEVLLGQMTLDQKPLVEVLRDGERQIIELSLSTIDEHRWLIPPQRNGETPHYFIRGGYVFQSLSLPYLEAWGRDWRKKAPDDIILTLDQFGSKVKSEAREDVVVLSQVLSHPVNMGHDNGLVGRNIVHAVNGEPLRGLKHLYEIMEESTSEKLELIIGEGQVSLLLDREVLKLSDAEISKWYSVGRLSFLP